MFFDETPMEPTTTGDEPIQAPTPAEEATVTEGDAEGQAEAPAEETAPAEGETESAA